MASPAENGAPGIKPPGTPLEIKNELIVQRLHCWLAKKERLDDADAAMRLSAFNGGNNNSNSNSNSKNNEGDPGCILPDSSEGYFYIPYDDSNTGLSPDQLERMRQLGDWMHDPRNAEFVKHVSKLLDFEVAECSPFLFSDGGEGGPPSSVQEKGVSEKVRICAQNRLLTMGGPKNSIPFPKASMFRFGIADVNQFGDVKMEWRFKSWSCLFSELTDELAAFSQPNFKVKDEIPRQLRELDTIQSPPLAVVAAQDIRMELLELSQKTEEVGDETKIACFYSNLKPKPSFKDPEWFYLEEADSFVNMVAVAKEKDLWPVVMRVSTFLKKFY
ncbi:hypothetical protein B0T17DRAFT_533653 [Bombardia bombarda]|uniref:Uncharacterized protein n=1 Tax=Bombardia bombarda TaxID=252184 RepID=A0AA39WTH5_9PEZI|nr:hypothetical protein B0T17DRAFT_533653 [Bombardia bombarda]